MTLPTSCPLPPTLSAWLDDELDVTESQSIRCHLEECTTCRDEVFGWLAAIEESGFEGSRGRGAKEDSGPTPSCLDPETIVAYSEAELSDAEATSAEAHLHTCTRCVAEVQRLIQLEVAVGPVLTSVPAAAELMATAEPSWGTRARHWLRGIADSLQPRWPIVSALGATAVLILVITRLVPLGPPAGEVQFRSGGIAPQVEVTADNVPARARPDEQEPLVVTLPRGTVATRLEASAEWTRLQLNDGRRVWVRSDALVRTDTLP